MGFPDLTITSLETITAYDVVTGDYKFTIDELQNTSIAQTQDKVDMTGKGGRKLNSLKRNKAVTISGANGMVSGGLLEMQTGGTFNDGVEMQVDDMTFSTLSGVQVTNGKIASYSGWKILYAECSPNTKYTISPARGYIVTFEIGWTKETPAVGLDVYDWTYDDGGSPTPNAKTIITGDDAEYIIVWTINSASSAYVEVQKEVDNGFEVAWTDYLTVATGPQHMYCTLSYKAVGTSGSEIVGVYARRPDGTLGVQFRQVATEVQLVTGTFRYNKEKDWILFYGDDVAEGDDIVVFYNRRVHADQLINYSDIFSGKATLYIDAFAEDKCANIYRIQFFVPKADFNGEFTFDLGDNQTIHNFEAEALAGACGTAGQLWTFTVFGTKDTFTIGGVPIEYDAGMTWGDWVDSVYNNGMHLSVLEVESGTGYITDGGDYPEYLAIGSSKVLSSDQIMDDTDYVMLSPFDYPVLLGLTISGFEQDPAFHPQESEYSWQAEGYWPEESVITFNPAWGVTVTCTVFDNTEGGEVPVRHENVRSGDVITWAYPPEEVGADASLASVEFVLTDGQNENSYSVQLLVYNP